MVLKILLKISIILLLLSCEKKEEYPVDTTGFTYAGQGNYDGQFGINGYYSAFFEDVVSLIYFFSDGTVCRFGVLQSDHSIGVNCPPISDKVRQLPYDWGAYIIEDGIIKIQTFHPYRGSGKFVVEEFRAEILNDTTIRYYKRILPGGDVRNINSVYHFRHCENKPDSNNVLFDYR